MEDSYRGEPPVQQRIDLEDGTEGHSAALYHLRADPFVVDIVAVGHAPVGHDAEDVPPWRKDAAPHWMVADSRSQQAVAVVHHLAERRQDMGDGGVQDLRHIQADGLTLPGDR